MDNILRFFSRRDSHLKLGNTVTEIKSLMAKRQLLGGNVNEGVFRCPRCYSCEWSTGGGCHLPRVPFPQHRANRSGSHPPLSPDTSSIIQGPL